MRDWSVVALAALLAACAKPAPEKVTPALWQVDGPHGERGYLFGTIHALPKEVDWRSAKLDAALAGSDSLVLEIARLDDEAATAATFAKLSRTPGQPLLSERIAPALRPALAAVLRRTHLFETEFAATETWAAALTLAQKLQGANNSGYGIDRALLNAAPGKALGELEGAETQLGVFDALPEDEQRDLLGAVISGADDDPVAAGQLASAWGRGDVAMIERETQRGMLADPELRQALLVNRNKAWTGRIVALLAQGERPFVAAGAAHMAGPDGVPALLAAQGYKVTRVQ
ncbi:MAG TPA: TraB/GumN family protein [Novosphingobium sp.]|nr:TraB/GumN family protein [Novosphingobium sp.]